MDLFYGNHFVFKIFFLIAHILNKKLNFIFLIAFLKIKTKIHML